MMRIDKQIQCPTFVLVRHIFMYFCFVSQGARYHQIYLQYQFDDMIIKLLITIGTERDTDGKLLSTAGTITVLDKFISESAEINAAFIDDLTLLIQTLDPTQQVTSSLYLATASKILSKGTGKGTDYIENEIRRLSSMISNPSVVPSSKTSFQLRQNVLKAFLK